MIKMAEVCKRNQNKKGSFTVEISLLMPMILSVTLILIYFVIYMYDRGVMQAAVCRGTEQVFYYMNSDNTKLEEECRKVILDDLQGRLVCIKETELSIKVSGNAIEAALYGELDVPAVVFLEDLELGSLWEIKVYWRELCLNPAELIRGSQQIVNIYQELSGEKTDNGSSVGQVIEAE